MGRWTVLRPGRRTRGVRPAHSRRVRGIDRSRRRLAALAGMVADPIQVSTGLHQRRLNRLIDTLEHNFTSGQEARLPLRSHYAARLTDLWDWTTMAYRLTRSGGGP